MLVLQMVGVLVFAVTYDSLDFHIYWEGGHALTDGTRLYSEQLVAHWFTNTPFMAAVFVPVGAIPLGAARVIWQVASVAALALACVNTMRMAGSRVAVCAVVAMALMLQPMWQSIFLGQVNMFLLAMVLIDVRRLSAGRFAGVGIGVAAAIKLTPAIFVVLLLVSGRIKAAMTACATFLVCSGFAHFVAPDASRLYWRHIFYDTSRVGVPYISNQSPYGAAVRILGDVEHVGSWYAFVPLVLGVVGLAVAAAWARKDDWLGAAAVAGVTGLLVSPISWAHHWVWVLPVLFVLARNGHRVAVGCGYALFVLSPLWWTPHGGHPRQYGFHWGLTLVANCYLVAGLCFLAYMAVRLRGAGAGDRDGRPGPATNAESDVSKRVAVTSF
ncbi:glycosyltransferase 87 family protein [Actinomadura rubrisoli]|uniref:glycosyltransferase 87 family protein n=1 Tax=Actinomadura rubrisoli TaxID=2530368 RepID=UPI001404FE20|nr:glycosyltransferase 87 family protein [Actinomadura rubrisoli]